MFADPETIRVDGIAKVLKNSTVYSHKGLPCPCGDTRPIPGQELADNLPLTVLLPTAEVPDWSPALAAQQPQQGPPEEDMASSVRPGLAASSRPFNEPGMQPQEIDSDSCPLTSLLSGERIGEAPGSSASSRGLACVTNPSSGTYTTNIGSWGMGRDQVAIWAGMRDGPDVCFFQEPKPSGLASVQIRIAGPYPKCWATIYVLESDPN
eukprot:1956028-Amphidinium_carterae.1